MNMCWVVLASIAEFIRIQNDDKHLFNGVSVCVCVCSSVCVHCAVYVMAFCFIRDCVWKGCALIHALSLSSNAYIWDFQCVFCV